MRILYPPRPQGKLASISLLSDYEKSGKWLVQRKFNGTRLLINVHNGKVSVLNRHGKAPARFKLVKEIKNEILSLDLRPDLEYWFDGELLGEKTKSPHYKNRIVLFDVLQVGDYLFRGPDLLARYNILYDICRKPQHKESHGLALMATPHIWLAENFEENFESRFQDFIDHDEIEGLVLKRKDSVIDDFGNEQYEVGWQIRVRKPHKNYGF